MNKIEALKILDTLYSFYPNFNKNNVSSFNEIWLQRLQEGDYEKTLRKVRHYTSDSKFPPSLADVFVPNHKPRDDGMAEAIKKSEETVKKENENPEVLEEKRQMIKEMRKKWGLANDRHQ